MALAPCLLGYGVAAQHVYTSAESVKKGNPYWRWIESYVADGYVEAVRKGSGRFRSWTASLLNDMGR
jgi:thiaminase